MRNWLLSGAAALILGVGALATSGAAQAAPMGIDPLVLAGQDMNLAQDAQYYAGGRQYCFYPNGWRGPGFYWCGYAWRRGYGWGGPHGWRGWGAPGRVVPRAYDRGYERRGYDRRGGYERGRDGGSRGRHGY